VPVLRFSPYLLVLLLTLQGACSRETQTAQLPDSVDFNLHIRPLLSDRCFKCHGPDANKRQANLRLDTREGALAALKDDPAGHALVPGKADQSEIFKRISSSDTSYVMPPPSSNLVLSPAEVDLIRKWIDQGGDYKPHWAFIPPKAIDPPSVDNAGWLRNEIDRFALREMQAHGLKPNPEADPARLLKRVCLDITGLPPTIELQNRFLDDPSSDSYERIVDELLATPQYGEKMAVYWMDVARYADSHGYQDDGLRTMWPWRDWVIHAFNKNYPYDQFVTWQLAGDLLPQPTKEQVLATGFNRNHKITQEGGVIQEEYRVEYVTDRTNTFGKAFLALTFECAHCHDHKYDPISQKQYYATFAFFNQVPEKGLVGDIQLASLADPPKIKFTTREIQDIYSFINKRDTTPVEVMVMKDSSRRRPTYILKRGVYDAHGDQVSFDLPEAILPFDSAKYGSNRLGLARWLFDERNPLTARVFVNRMWQEVFGRGLVKTAGDFGMQGDLPSHPDLLDWLAVDFRTHGWNIKRLIRQMVVSATYRQSAQISREKLAIDPENIWLSRAPRLRLSAEGVRDLALSSSDLLNKEIGGPSVKGYQPPGLWESSTSGRGVLAHYVQDHGENLYRRGLYNFIKRTVPPPGMLVFDASNRDQCEVRRLRTNTPLQSLLIMNDPAILEASRVYAERLSRRPLTDKERIEFAFRGILCRKPGSDELDQLVEYFHLEKLRFAAAPALAEARLQVGEFPRSEGLDAATTAALMQVIHTLYNLEETITKT